MSALSQLTRLPNRRRWEAHLLQSIARRPEAKAEYVVLRSEQLVGTALIVIVKTSIINSLRSVEAANKKTGLKGMAGNKGGIAIRLDWADSSFCFVTAHFAAGTNNIEERDQNYVTISQELALKRGRTIGDHESVSRSVLDDASLNIASLTFVAAQKYHLARLVLYMTDCPRELASTDAPVLLGDFNYRVSMPTDMARQLAQEEDIDALLRHDQLSKCSAFKGFTE